MARKQYYDDNNLPLSFMGITTCYLNVSIGNNYSTSGEDAYIAIGRLTEEQQEMMNINTHMVHLAYCDDVRDAAYIAQTFNDNPDKYIAEFIEIGQGNFIVNCPVWKHPAVMEGNRDIVGYKSRNKSKIRKSRFDFAAFMKSICEELTTRKLKISDFVPKRDEIIELGEKGLTASEAVDTITQ